MSFPSGDVVRAATRYYQTVAVAMAIKTLRPDLADRVFVPDNGPIAVLIDVGRDRRVVVAQVAGRTGLVWTIATASLDDDPPPTWPLGTDHQVLAKAAIARVDTALAHVSLLRARPSASLSVGSKPRIQFLDNVW